MSEHKQRMLEGELYRADDHVLLAERERCQRLLDQFNATSAADTDELHRLLEQLLGGIGRSSCVLPRLTCDYGYLTTIGENTFINYDAVLLDCAPITIGDDVAVGSRVQLLTPLHPLAEHELRREGWESAQPITVGNNVWLGGGVIVCPGVTIGDRTVVGAGSVVTRDLPSETFAAGNPCRVIRAL